MNFGSDLASAPEVRGPTGRRVGRGAALRALFARLGAGRAGDWLEAELREDLKRKGARTEDGLASVVRRALVLEIPDPRAPSAAGSGIGRPSLLDVLAISAARLARHLPASRETIARVLLSGPAAGATPVADGIALPHARLERLSRPDLLLARCPRGVAMLSRRGRGPDPERRRIRAVLVLVSSSARPRRHLRLLADLAARADNPRFLPRFLSASDAEALRDVLLRTAPRPASPSTHRPEVGRAGPGPGSGRWGRGRSR